MNDNSNPDMEIVLWWYTHNWVAFTTETQYKNDTMNDNDANQLCVICHRYNTGLINIGLSILW